MPGKPHDVQTCPQCGAEKPRAAFRAIPLVSRCGVAFERLTVVCAECRANPLRTCAKCMRQLRQRTDFERTVYLRAGQRVTRWSHLCRACLLPARAVCPRCREEKDRKDFGVRTKYGADGRPHRRLVTPCTACRTAQIAEDRMVPAVRHVMNAQFRAKRARQGAAYRAYRRACYQEHRARRRATDNAWKRRRRAAERAALADRYVTELCRLYDTTLEALRQPGRDPQQVEQRAILSYLLVSGVRLSLSEVARLLDQDHTTVLHHVTRLRRYKRYEEREVIRMLKEAVGQYWFGNRAGGRSTPAAARKAG